MPQPNAAPEPVYPPTGYVHHVEPEPVVEKPEEQPTESAE